MGIVVEVKQIVSVGIFSYSENINYFFLHYIVA